MRAGASGFVLKRAEPEQLYGAIRLVGAGRSTVFPQAARPAPAASPRPVRARDSTPFDRLTVREAEVLRLMAAGRSNVEIAKELFIGLYTVKSHVASILRKLSARDRTQAIALAYRAGFISEVGPPYNGG